MRFGVRLLSPNTHGETAGVPLGGAVVERQRIELDCRMNGSDADLIAYSDGSYSTSDTGCVGDTIGIAPRLYPSPDYLREYVGWSQALQEDTDTCVLQNGVCWILKPEQLKPRFGQEADGGCPGCRGPGPTGFAGVTITTQGQRMQQGVPRRTDARVWRPTAVVTPEGVAAIRQGAVLPLWQRIFNFTPPDRIVYAPAGLDYKSAVYGAQVVSVRTGKPMVVNGVKDGRTIPMIYVEPGGLVRGSNGVRTPVRGWETDTYALDPFELRQAFAASRGGSIMPWNAVGG